MTIAHEDLKKMREALVYRRRHGLYDIDDYSYGPWSSTDAEKLEKVVQLHLAIQAIDAVIAEGPEAILATG